MTREEAIEQLEFMLEQMTEEPPTQCDYIDEWLDTHRKIRNAFEMAIKALIDEKVKEMVERKKGKWINKSQKSGCGITFIASECTCCGKKTFFNCDELIYRFCPNCGAEMEGEDNDDNKRYGNAKLLCFV